MTDDTFWPRNFEQHRPHLHSVAYRMLGSTGEADDAVQEAWLRLSRSDSDQVENLRAWLTTVVGRVSLDMLRARKARREDPDEHLEPIVSEITDEQPAEEANYRRLGGPGDAGRSGEPLPAERVAFVLHDMFGVPFSEIGEISGRSPDAARQLASRARRRVRGSDAPSRRRRRAEQRRASSTHSLPPPAPATSRHCSRCSTPTSSSASTPVEGDPRAEALAGGRCRAGRRARPVARRPPSSRPCARPAIGQRRPGLRSSRRPSGKILGATALHRQGTAGSPPIDLVLEPPPGHGSS